MKRADGSVPAKHAKKAAKHPAKKAATAAKHAAKKTAKKHAGKAAKHVPRKSKGLKSLDINDRGLMTAFHHMQRASAVISLMQKGTGKDLRKLLDRGVKLYRRANEGGPNDEVVLRAIGVLRAAEHLSMAGLYVARAKHKQDLETPAPKWLADFIAQTKERLAEIEHTESDTHDKLFSATIELLQQADDSDEEDSHLAFELVMAADSLCFALENGL